jgi:uncharacterized protein
MLDIAEEFRRLIRLQAIDAERHALQLELTSTPKELAATRVELDAARAVLNASIEAVAAKKKEISVAERSLTDVERRRERARNRMPNLVTSTQIDATQREIACLGEDAGQLEEQILEAMEELEALEELRDGQDQALQEGEAALSARTAGWVDRKLGLDARFAELDVDRAPIMDNLRTDVSRRYQIAWSQPRNPPGGITTTDSAFVCVTCQCRLSPMWVQESQNHRALHACDYCKRILVFDPDATDEVAQADEAAAEEG